MAQITATQSDRIHAIHRDWTGSLLFDRATDTVRHEGMASRGRYAYDGDVLTVKWDNYPPDTFSPVDGVYVDRRLLDRAPAVDRAQIVRLGGRLRRCVAVEVAVPEVGADVLVRLGTSDPLVFNQVFGDREYDIDGLPRDARTVMDLGANIGLATLFFADRYPAATVVAVEPDPSNFAQLLRNTAALGTRVHCVHAAVWLHDGTINLKYADGGGQPLDAWGIQVTEADGQGRIPCRRLASLMQSAGITAIDLLKVDIEGAERELFSSGIDDCLESIDCIVIETHDRFCPGSDAAVRRALADRFIELNGKGENLVFRRRDAVRATM